MLYMSMQTNLPAAMSSFSNFCLIALPLVLYYYTVTSAAVDPTLGFRSLSIGQSNFQVQKPYDKAVSERYSFINGVHRLWVFSNDKPHTPTSNTNPRTEVRITGYDYSSGVWQFEGYGYVPSGTTGVSIMQVFGASGRATTVMVHVYNGSLRRYNQQVLAENIYDRWFKLNVIHDVDASTVKIYVDDDLKYQGRDSGGNSHYFKYGVYEQGNPSHRMESRWRNIRVLKKNY